MIFDLLGFSVGFLLSFMSLSAICFFYYFLLANIFYLQAHNDLMRTYEAKLSQFGIPTEELGFRPLESTVGGQPLGQGPAGLVAAPN